MIEGPKLQNPTLEFQHEDTTVVAVRHWYHVPQIGDLVTLDDPAVAYHVVMVYWSDEKIRILVEQGVKVEFHHEGPVQ